MSENGDTAHLRPRLCHLRKWSHFQGYGFNLHAEKSRNGQFIGKVDSNSPAEMAGLNEKDRIIEVNFVNISNENHQQVVKRIRNGLEMDGKVYTDEVVMLVVDQETDDLYKKLNKVIKNDDSNVLKLETPHEEDLNGQQQNDEEDAVNDSHQRDEEHEEATRRQSALSPKIEPSPPANKSSLSNKSPNLLNSSHNSANNNFAPAYRQEEPHSDDDQNDYEQNKSNHSSSKLSTSAAQQSNGQTKLASRTPSQNTSLKTPTLSEKSNHLEDSNNNNTKASPIVEQKKRASTVPAPPPPPPEEPSPQLSAKEISSSSSISPRSNNNNNNDENSAQPHTGHTIRPQSATSDPFKMSAAEFKNYLKNKPKADPRESHVDIKQKFKIFQEM